MSLITDDILGGDPLLTPAEVARMFRVKTKTVFRWSADGRITAVKTPGGRSRFRQSEVRALLSGGAR
jgi:excisionase family DNA binding protein